MFPTIILVLIAIPSMSSLYYTENELQYNISIGITGNSWYWSYYYSDIMSLSFDMYIKNRNRLSLGEFRKLEVDNVIVLPTLTPVRLLISRADVIHSWSIPQLYIKVDANPGYVTICIMERYIPNVYTGVCSEICGSGHSIMSIALETTSINQFVEWILLQHNDNNQSEVYNGKCFG